jgi:acetyl-CoA carboxylase biotin carboxyl carrier protein
MPRSGKSDNGKASGKPSDRLDELLKLMEEENLQELEIVDGPFEVKLVRQGRAPIVHHSSHHAPRAHAPAPAASKAGGEAKGDDFGKLVPVKSPLAGVFYRSPSPQAAPFVKEGDTVNPEKAVCIVEAMKVLNEIVAGASGTVVRILVENGKPISAGQNLFLIDPAG